MKGEKRKERVAARIVLQLIDGISQGRGWSAICKRTGAPIDVPNSGGHSLCIAALKPGDGDQEGQAMRSIKHGLGPGIRKDGNETETPVQYLGGLGWSEFGVQSRGSPIPISRAELPLSFDRHMGPIKNPPAGMGTTNCVSSRACHVEAGTGAGAPVEAVAYLEPVPGARIAAELGASCGDTNTYLLKLLVRGAATDNAPPPSACWVEWEALTHSYESANQLQLKVAIYAKKTGFIELVKIQHQLYEWKTSVTPFALLLALYKSSDTISLNIPFGSYRKQIRSSKGQALADFLAAHPASDDTPLSDDLPDEEVLYAQVQFPWEMYFDGSSRSGGRDESRASGGLLSYCPATKHSLFTRLRVH
ncbi:hypothetical protein QYF36_012025 [Acer negundo]|nr:hypothetical protein QYF36_012025 [Acer negundo]